MGLGLAIQAFFKAFKDPKKAQQFIEGKAKVPATEKSDHSHLYLLSLLQQSSRLVDFLKEDISSFSDAQVGAAVRKIHADCGKSLEDLITIRPLYEEKEGETISVAAGYNPNEVRIVGKIKGEPPFKGILVHRGWKAHKRSLPKKLDELPDVICPAEIEVK